MNQEQYKALTEVVNYLYHDEQKHFEEEDKPKEHIFRDVRLLANYLEDMKGIVNEDQNCELDDKAFSTLTLLKNATWLDNDAEIEKSCEDVAVYLREKR